MIELVGAAAVGAFIAKAIERFEHFEFAMLNAVADLDEGGDTATGRVYIWEIRADRGTGRWTNAFGRLRRPLRQAGRAVGHRPAVLQLARPHRPRPRGVRLPALAC